MSMGGGSTTQTTTQELSQEQRDLLAPVIPIATNFLKNPPKQWSGSAIAGFNPLQELAQRMTLDASKQFLPQLRRNNQQLQTGLQQIGQGQQGLLRAGQGVLPNQIAAQNRLLSGEMLDPRRNPALARVTQAAIDPLVQNFQQNILPSIMGDAIGSGTFGGTRQGVASGIAGQQLTRSIGDVTADVQNNAYNAGLDAMTQMATAMPANQSFGQLQSGFGALTNGLALSPEILSASLMPAQLTASVGEQQQALTQARLSEQVQKFINKQLLPFSIAQDVASMAFGVPAGTTKTVTEGGGGGGGMMAMQMGMGLLGMLPMLFSDRRLKTAIEKVGELVDGLAVYTYKLFGLDTIGLMADEVYHKYPEAVMFDPSGYVRLDYAKVPSWN